MKKVTELVNDTKFIYFYQEILIHYRYMNV